MKIAIVVLSHFDNDVYSELFKIQNETWNSIDVEDVDTFFLIGNCDENKIDGNVIKTTAPESIHCGEKVVESFKLLNNIDYDFIFRTNSSSYVDKIRLKKFIETNCDEDTYCGLTEDGIEGLYVSGCGYIISKKNLNLICINENLWNYKYLWDDMSLGYLMKKLNIPIKLGFRQDIVSDLDYIDLNQYHYRLKCNCSNRVEVERLRFIKIFNLKKNDGQNTNYSIYKCS